MTTPMMEIERKAAAISADAMALSVQTNAAYEQAAHLLKLVAAMRGEIAATFRPVIASAHAAHKAAIAAQAQHDRPLALAETHLRLSMGDWSSEQERLRHVEELRLDAELRQRAEAQARAEAEDRVLEAAVEAEKHGLGMDIEREVEREVAATPIYIGPVVLPQLTPAIDGISSRQTWKADVIDFSALVRAVAAGQVPIEALQPNAVFLGQQARSMRSALRYPGVRVWSETSMAVRR